MSSQKSTVQIRSADSNDVPNLAKLVQAQFAYQKDFDSDLRLVPGISWTEFVRNLIDGRNREVFVAERKSILVGYISILVVNDRTGGTRRSMRGFAREILKRIRKAPVEAIVHERYGFIEDIFVDESLRHSALGIGVRLFRRSLTWFSDRGIDRIDALIDSNNIKAISFSEKLGFRPRKVLMRRVSNGDSSSEAPKQRAASISSSDCQDEKL